MNAEAALLDRVFGEGAGDTPRDRAIASSRTFVRSMDQLAFATPTARGRRLAAFEALEAYGLEVLAEVADEGAALLCESPDAAARLVRDRRELLNLDRKAVSVASGVSLPVLEAVEGSKRVPIRDLERIARVLGLDERFVSWRSDPVMGNNDLAVRLRVIGDERPRMSPFAAGAIAEAAWIATTQLRLQWALNIHPTLPGGLEPSPKYGEAGYPAYSHGYWLASLTRKQLGLGERELPVSLREVAEDRLGIPVIQSDLGPSIAGVTVEVGRERAVVLNLVGKNRHVFVRRFTLAHELGHLLFDPPQELKQLRVDDYEDLERPPHAVADRVEQRANAFAVEFIAPRSAVLELYEGAGPDRVGRVMNTFGLSYTAARFQIWNALGRGIPLTDLETTTTRPSAEWEGKEAYTVDYHPIRGIRGSRSGRFSAVVVRAAAEKAISWDTATEMLEAESPEEVKAAEPVLRELFPSVFSQLSQG